VPPITRANELISKGQSYDNVGGGGGGGEDRAKINIFRYPLELQAHRAD